MAVYLTATLVLVPIVGRVFFRRMGTDENIEFVFVMALVFVVSFLAHLAGLEPIIVAFLAGLTLNRLIPEKGRLMSRIHFTGDAIFIPFFLLSVGMLVDIRLLFAGTAVWIVVAGMAVTALSSKLFAAIATSRLLRYDRNEAGLLYGMSVNQAAATLAPHRILVPVGAREGTKELLDVAILLRSESSQEPVYPVRVVHEDSHVEAELARAENALAHSVVRAMSLGMPVTPLTVVDVNIGSGLVRAARDNRISLIVCGWDPDDSTRSHGLGRTIDQVVEHTKRMIIVNRLRQPVNSARRIVVMLPPFAERQTGFERVVTTVKTLAGQTGVPILLLATAQTLQTAGAFMQSARPAVPLSSWTIPVWKRVGEHLQTHVDSGDWLVLVTDRKGEIAWQPNLERLPRLLADALPATNLSVVFPPTESWDGAATAEAVTEPERTISRFSAERTVFGTSAGTTGEIVTTLLARFFGPRSASAEAVSELLVKISREEPVELVEDVVLLHAHVPFANDTVVFMAVAQPELDIPVAGNPPHILLILLDPVGQDPAKHLKALADIARLVRLPGIVTALREVRDYERFRAEVRARQADSEDTEDPT